MVYQVYGVRRTRGRHVGMNVSCASQIVCAMRGVLYLVCRVVCLFVMFTFVCAFRHWANWCVLSKALTAFTRRARGLERERV